MGFERGPRTIRSLSSLRDSWRDGRGADRPADRSAAGLKESSRELASFMFPVTPPGTREETPPQTQNPTAFGIHVASRGGFHRQVTFAVRSKAAVGFSSDIVKKSKIMQLVARCDPLMTILRCNMFVLPCDAHSIRVL